jgi:hypothetical protein
LWYRIYAKVPRRHLFDTPNLANKFKR